MPCMAALMALHCASCTMPDCEIPSRTSFNRTFGLVRARSHIHQDHGCLHRRPRGNPYHSVGTAMRAPPTRSWDASGVSMESCEAEMTCRRDVPAPDWWGPPSRGERKTTDASAGLINAAAAKGRLASSLACLQGHAISRNVTTHVPTIKSKTCNTFTRPPTLCCISDRPSLRLALTRHAAYAL